jgi:hypothetical protein
MSDLAPRPEKSKTAGCRSRSDPSGHRGWIAGIGRRVVDERLSPRRQMAAELRIAIKIKIWLICAIGRVDEDFRRKRLFQIRAIIVKIRALLRVLPPDRPGAPSSDSPPVEIDSSRRDVIRQRPQSTAGPPDDLIRRRPSAANGGPSDAPRGMSSHQTTTPEIIQKPDSAQAPWTETVHPAAAIPAKHSISARRAVSRCAPWRSGQGEQP